MNNCLIDEGRPLDAGFQEMASNHFKLLHLRGVVVSVEAKGAVNASGKE